MGDTKNMAKTFLTLLKLNKQKNATFLKLSLPWSLGGGTPP
jgi:hypothetical protein